MLTYEDILSVIAPDLLTDTKQLPLGSSPLEVQIIQQIQQGNASLDGVLSAVEASTTEILQSVTAMELAGTLRVVAGRLYL